MAARDLCPAVRYATSCLEVTERRLKAASALRSAFSGLPYSLLARLALLATPRATESMSQSGTGRRGLGVRRGRRARILSRNRRILEPYFPELNAAALKSLPDNCSLDGELLGLNDGKPDFSALLERLGGRLDRQVQFVAFDLLSLEGKDLGSLPLGERRRQLVSITTGGGPICSTLQTDELDAEAWLKRSRILPPRRCGREAGESALPPRESVVGQGQALGTADLIVGGCAGTPNV
jgi:hypothetical protein